MAKQSQSVVKSVSAGSRSIGGRLVARAIASIDSWYRRRYDLRPLGPVLFLSRSVYRGGERQFSDGTRLLDRQVIGELHFNNACIAELGGGTRQRVGVRFARAFRESLAALAIHAQSSPEFLDVSVYHGITWFKAHGGKVGFLSDPIPDGLQSWWRRHYFRLLTLSFSPLATRTTIETSPRAFWITRNDLIKYFGGIDGDRRGHTNP